ncbi:MAG: ABC transporter ATP-binding protein [Defluviitaleaceae bacterium]|nr:ABC transporter ATP-binding protein [Defluviitaleaceae bacterium]
MNLLSKVLIENINKHFGGNHVLKDVSLDINEGEFVSILGPSGCGKTTLLKLIAGLEAPTGGSVFIGGSCCDNIPARKRGAVIVFQDYGLFPHMTVTANIEFGLSARKESRALRAEKVTHMLNVMQISDKASCYPHELSGGQKQRVALARACVLEPKLLLLDEPFSNLDTGLKDVMREFVLKLQRELGITTILVTHDKEEAFMLSQRVAVLLDGRLQQFDTPQQIYSRPASKRTADFIGEANYISGTVIAGIFSCFLGNFNASGIPDGDASLMLRYDHIRFDRNDGIPCRILEKKFRGRITTYRVVTLHEPVTELTLNSPDDGIPLDNCPIFIKAVAGTGWVLE